MMAKPRRNAEGEAANHFGPLAMHLAAEALADCRSDSN